MKPADAGRGAAAWTHATVLLCLLLLLTYLFNESKDAGRQSRRHLQEGLRTLQIHDAQLSRDVLMARAGRLANYDPLMQDRQRLLEDLEALAQAGMRGLPEAAGEVVADRLSLDRAVREQLADVEHFKSENALTRNSLLYLTRAAAVLDADTEMRKLGALPSAHVQQALLRFVETLDTDAGAQIKAELDALAGGAPQGSPPLLVAHGRLIVDVLPGVDALLQRIVGAPTTARARDFEAALQRYDNQAEGRAQVLRYALYFFCLLLFGYLVHQFVQIRASAASLRASNASLQLEMAERAKAEIDLRHSEERYRAITQFANEAIISVDGQGRIVSWNIGAATIFGYSGPEVMNQPLARLMPPRLSPRPGLGFLQWRQAEAPQAAGAPVESTGVRADGSEVAIEISRSTWRTSQGEFETGIVRDLTERRRLLEVARQQELQLIHANKMSSLGTLVMGVAHEINNPNQAIASDASTIAMAWADAAAHLDASWAQDQAFMLCGLPYAEMRTLIPARLDDVADCSRRIAAKVSTLLDFGRPRTADRSARFSLNAAVRRVVGMMRWSIEQQASGCTLALGDDLPDVRGDIGEIEQVLINLTSNALQSIDGRAGGLRIATSFDAASGLLLAVVEDGGCGIAPEHLERLCEAYFTTRQDCGGTGLGLAISASLVQAHHGTLRFESAPGRGTRAFLALPCAAAAAAAPGALAEASRWS